MYAYISSSTRTVTTLWRFKVLLGALLFLGCPWTTSLANTAPVAPPHAPALWVDFREGRLSIEATEALWVHVVDEVRRTTGLHLHLYVPLEGAVTVSVQALPVEQALRRLFGPEANLAFRYPPAERRPATAPASPSDVWVLGKGLGPAVDTPADQGEVAAGASADPDVAGAAAPEERLAALDAFAEQGNMEVLQQALADPDQSVQRKALEILSARDGPGTIALLAGMAQSTDRATRTQALFLLYDTGMADPAVPLEQVLFEGQRFILQGQELPPLQEPSR